jgi:sarcosine oxidase delta subunit
MSQESMTPPVGGYWAYQGKVMNSRAAMADFVIGVCASLRGPEVKHHSRSKDGSLAVLSANGLYMRFGWEKQLRAKFEALTIMPGVQPVKTLVYDKEAQLRVQELEKELAELREQAKGKGVQNTPADAQASTGSLPPPSTYAEAVRRELNRAKHAEARADKINREKMAAVSRAAAELKTAEKEAALLARFKEGYQPLASRKEALRVAAQAKAKRPETIREKTAKVAHTFVRYTRAQMKEHQQRILQQSGCDRWFSAAERAAYKALSPARKAEIKAERLSRQLASEKAKAAERQKFRMERIARSIAIAKERTEALARPKAKVVRSERFFPSGKGRVVTCNGGQGCRLVVNAAGTETRCRDCHRAGTTE